MAKRGAALQLTDRNWDQEEESEEAGHFKVAGDDKLSKRVIKKARRRVPGSESTNTFKGFQGFGIPQNSSTPMVNNASNTFTGFKGFGNQSEKKEISNEKTSNSSVKTANSDSAYMTQLKRLNQEVCEWIKKHINENPYVDLSPIFKDYEKHLLNLEKKFPAVSKPAGLNEIASTKVTTLSTANVQAVRGLSSSVGMPTLNGNTCLNSSQPAVVKSSGTEADDVPETQSQVKSTPEEDAFYSTRCKLFFKRDNDWSELGVGMLSLKKTSNKKMQVLVRNDTALGKIVLNVFVTEATPTSRSGKNNILLMSVPNPPVFIGKEGDNTKPASYLIRVKTAENADELHKHLQTAKD